jgi:hypothetical protein
VKEQSLYQRLLGLNVVRVQAWLRETQITEAPVTLTAIRRVPTAFSLFFFRTRRNRRSKRHVFYEKKICWRLYGDLGDCTAIMLRLHGVYTVTACDLWAFVPRFKRFHYVFTAFLLRSKHFHCVFKALSPNDDRNEQQTFFQHLYHGSKEG